jgi:hypothetical protein
MPDNNKLMGVFETPFLPQRADPELVARIAELVRWQFGWQ